MSDVAKRPRFFVPDLPARPGGRRAASSPAVSLPPTESHHAVHVLRLKSGDPVELFDGRGASALGRIDAVRRDAVAATIEEVRPPAARPEPILHLAFAVPKGDRLDWLLEKATELGAASLRPVAFHRSVAGTGRLSPAKRGRWLARCIAAAKQAGLDFLPDLGDPVPLDDFLGATGDTLGLCGDLGADSQGLPRALHGRRPHQPVTLLVGPEGGLTDEERLAIRRAGFLFVRLGRTTLRIETAAVALLAATLAILEKADLP